MRTARLLVDHILGCHLPVIAAVNGPAVGLGCSLAVSADIVLMADNAYLADTHVSIGLVAGDGGVVTWPFMISMLKAKEYLFTGDRIPAETAVEIGLANRVVPADSLMSEALLLAHRLAGEPAQALQETKRALNLHLQEAALRVLPYALSAEDRVVLLAGSGGDGAQVRGEITQVVRGEHTIKEKRSQRRCWQPPSRQSPRSREIPRF